MKNFKLKLLGIIAIIAVLASCSNEMTQEQIDARQDSLINVGFETDKLQNEAIKTNTEDIAEIKVDIAGIKLEIDNFYVADSLILKEINALKGKGASDAQMAQINQNRENVRLELIRNMNAKISSLRSELQALINNKADESEITNLQDQINGLQDQINDLNAEAVTPVINPDVDPVSPADSAIVAGLDKEAYELEMKLYAERALIDSDAANALSHVQNCFSHATNMLNVYKRMKNSGNYDRKIVNIKIDLANEYIKLYTAKRDILNGTRPNRNATKAKNAEEKIIKLKQKLSEAEAELVSSSFEFDNNVFEQETQEDVIVSINDIPSYEAFLKNEKQYS